MSTSSKLLNNILDLELELALTTWQNHWNVESASFSELHELFGNQYRQMLVYIDEVAERLRQIGEQALVGAVNVKNDPGSASKMIDSLMLAHKAVANKLVNTSIPEVESSPADYVTMDLFIKLAAWHEKQAWMLRSYGRGA